MNENTQSLKHFSIHPDVLDEIQFNGRYYPDRVACGLLLGQKSGDGDEYSVEIQGFTAGEHFRSVEDFGSYLHAQWGTFSIGAQRVLKNAQILGWYAAWPDNDHEPGRIEALLHHTFFPAAWKLALWVTPDSTAALVHTKTDKLDTVQCKVLASPTLKNEAATTDNASAADSKPEPVMSAAPADSTESKEASEPPESH